MALRACLWFEARLLPLRIGQRRLDAVLAIADEEAPHLHSALAPAEICRLVKRATRHPLLMRNRRCLRQGVLGMRALRAAGHRPQLHFGVDPRSLDRPLPDAHCWIVLDEEVLMNPPDIGMVTIHRHAPQ
jgi:hypothetical protein